MPHQNHIWQCPQCGGSVDISQYGFYTRVTCPSCAFSERVHTRLSNFRIEGMLGVGGMSLVFRGRDLVLDREVALKLLNDTYKTQDNRIARFERECALMARVRHRNVASIYAAGRVDEQFYIAMELVRGKNVEDLLVNGATLEQERALDIIMQVALGLNAAHQVGLLHRDVKPGNILLTEDDEAKVIDFGLSLQSTDTDDEEMIWATPFYVPPETLRREPEDVRTDIYALGMTLRHLLTGSDKLQGDPSSAEDLLAVKENLPPVCQLNKSISPALGKLIDRMSAYSPHDRPADYHVLLDDMMRCVAQLRRKASFSSFLRSGRFMRRVLLCLGCAVAGGLAVVWALPLLTAPRYMPPVALMNHPQLGDYKLLTQALAQGDWAKACDLARVLRTSSDPELAAWGGTLAWMLACLSLDESSTQNQDWEEAKLLLTKLEQGTPETGSLYKDLLSLKAWVTQGDTPEMQDALLLSIYQMMLDRDGATVAQWHSLDRATQCLEAAAPPYKNLRTLLSSRRDGLLHSLAASSKAQSLAEALPLLHFEHLMQMVKRVQEQGASEILSDERLKAILQICQAGTALLDVTQPEGVDWRSLTQAEILEQYHSIDASRYAELRCLCLLLQSRYEEALASNPHEADAPFSVLMRHWCQSFQGSGNSVELETKTDAGADEPELESAPKQVQPS